MSHDDDHTMERLLQAFDEGPEAPADVDDAVDGILTRLGIDGTRPVPRPAAPPPPQARTAPPWLPWVALLVLGLGMAVLAGVLIYLQPDAPMAAAPTERVATPEVAASGGPLVVPGEPVEDPATEPTVEPDGEPVADLQPEPSPSRSDDGAAPDTLDSPAVEAPERLAVVEPRGDPDGAPPPIRRGASMEGLVRHGDASVRLRGGAAVLSDGMLTFVRNGEIRPSVDRVRFATVPVVAVPVGTVFTASAAPGMGLVAVDEGRVFLTTVDHRPLAEVRPGESVAVVDAPSAPGGLAVLRLDGVALDEAVASIPPGSAAQGDALRRAVGELRLADLRPETLQTLLGFGEEDHY